MELVDVKSIILQLKAVRDREKISILDIVKKTEAIGEPVSETTVRRVFAENSETEDSFSYDRTIRPIAEALLDSEPSAENGVEEAKNHLLLTVLREKNGVIDRQAEKIALLQEQIDTIRAEYDRRVLFLREQIEKKDRRMDEKDGLITRLMDENSELVRRLLDGKVGKK